MYVFIYLSIYPLCQSLLCMERGRHLYIHICIGFSETTDKILVTVVALET